MSVDPPSSGRPTGPPSGPLSGPSEPPSGPPSQPPSGGGGGGGGTPGGPGPQPWWRSVPRIAVITAVVVAAVVVAVVLSRGGGGSSDTAAADGEVFLQAADKEGPDPFTESTAKDSTTERATPSAATESAPSNAVRGVDGGAAGLYGGTRDVASCDVEKQIRFLRDDPDKNKAFASVAHVEPSRVPDYLRSLTPVQLRLDTRVTNHGYKDGVATSYQAVLQAGTAVLVDDKGVPRARCACGNPLTPPVPQKGTVRHTGDSWPGFRSSEVVMVMPAKEPVDEFVIYDDEHDEWIARKPGDDVDKDKKTERPAKPSPSVSVSPPTSPGTETPKTPGTSTPGTSTPETETSEPTTTEPEPGTTTSQPPPDGGTTTTTGSASTGPDTASSSL
ncbi:DUF6777 domain-containing protein [Streptomyces nigra]|uniref:DUF6777 domain-containing protein n=1 Tax=Streptomyces nigra TaxID=1827580 RepID=UPI001ABF4FBE|nr:DUF6777 domain-containing protein [Streptomyces nigra]